MQPTTTIATTFMLPLSEERRGEGIDDRQIQRKNDMHEDDSSFSGVVILCWYW